MLLALLYQLIRYITDLALGRTQSDAQLRAEVWRCVTSSAFGSASSASPAWQPGNRLLLAALSRLLPRSGFDALLPRPPAPIVRCRTVTYDIAL